MNRIRPALLATAALAAAFISGGTADAASLEGEVTFADGSGAITSGGSGNFSMGVPPGSACQGPGSLGYRWETFLVSADVDIVDMTFSAGPDAISGSFVAPLFDLDGNQVSTKFPSASPLGLISGIPSISLTNTVNGFGLAGIPVGGYRIGIACTFQNNVQEYWTTYLDITADPEDTPLGIAWDAAGEPTPTTTTSTSTTTTTVAGGGDTTTTSTTEVPADSTPTSDAEQFGTGPVTGGNSTAIAVLALVALVVGRAVILSARRVKVLPPR